MNLQTIRQRFSMFLKQFRIEDLKLLMKFLNEIVIEYKNSNASRLFDLLSHQESNENDGFHLIYDDYPNNDSTKKINNHNSNNKFQNDKLRRIKLTNARKVLLNTPNPNGLKRMNSDLFEKQFKNGMNANQKEIKQETEHTDSDQLSAITAKRLSSDNQTFEKIDKENSKLSNKKSKLIDQNKSLYHEPHPSNLGINYSNADSENNSNTYDDDISGYNGYDNGEIKNVENTVYTNDQPSPSRFNFNSNNTFNSKSNSDLKRIRLDSSWLNNRIEDESLRNLIKCAVCNDSASGTRYGVCVCEGCKEFFRRQRENPTNNKVLKCVHGTNNCEINVENRTQCRKCRLDKCLKLGMKLSGKLTQNSTHDRIESIAPGDQAMII